MHLFKFNFSIVVALLAAWSLPTFGNSIARVHFADNENNEIGAEQLQQPIPEKEQFAFALPEQSNTAEFANDSVVNTTVPELAEVAPAGYPDSQPRTLHHIVNKINFVETGIQSAVHKLLSLLFPSNLPHSNNADYIYRKDGSAPQVRMPSFLKPLANIPQYLTNHPINFRKHLSQFQHAISKRSIVGGDNNEAQILPSGNRQGRTLHKIIPNFEANFNNLFRKIFPQPIFSQPQSYSNNDLYKAEATNTSPSTYKNRQGPFGSQSSVGFTNLMRMIPQLFNRRYSASLDGSSNLPPQDIISANLQRIMGLLRRPLFQQNNSAQ